MSVQSKYNALGMTSFDLMTQAKTICLLGLTHTIDDTRIYHKMAQSLSKDFRVIIIAEGQTDAVLTEGNITRQAISKKNGRLRYLWRFVKAGFRTQADIFVANEMESFPLALLLRLFNRKKIVFDCHEFYPSYLQQSPSFILRVSIYGFIFLRRFMSRCFAGIITVTPVMQNEYQKYHSKVITIFNFPSSSLFSKIKANQDLKYQDKTLLIYQGGVFHTRKIKLYFEIIDALKSSIPNIFLLIIGRGILGKEVEQFIKKQHLEQYYEWKQGLPFAETLGYTKIASLGLNCMSDTYNVINSVPNKMFEYAGFGVPILGTKNIKSFLEFVVAEGAGEAISGDDTNEAVHAVQKMLAHREDYQKNCLRVIQKYNWENQEKILLEFYHSLFAQAI